MMTYSGWHCSSIRSVLLVLLVAALLGLCQQAYPFFSLPALGELGIDPKPEEVQKHQIAYQQFYSRNGAMLFALIGCILAISLALSHSHRKLLAASIGSLGGCTLGAAGGFAAGWMVHQTTWLSQDESIIRNFAIHLIAWTPAILGSVTGVAIVHERWPKSMLLALASGLPAILIVSGYIVSASILFANANSTNLMPEYVGPRILWTLSAAVLFAVGFKIILNKSLASPPQKQIIETTPPVA